MDGGLEFRVSTDCLYLGRLFISFLSFAVTATSSALRARTFQSLTWRLINHYDILTDDFGPASFGGSVPNTLT